MQGWKQGERNQWHKNAAAVTEGNGNNGTKLEEVANARHEYSVNSKYGKPLAVKYTDSGFRRVLIAFG